jgi:hypothetical protein
MRYPFSTSAADNNGSRQVHCVPGLGSHGRFAGKIPFRK